LSSNRAFVPETLEILDELHDVWQSCVLVGLSIGTKAAVDHFITPPLYSCPESRFAKAHKSLLPTYDVFDEDRYFQPAARVEPFDLNGKKIGVTILRELDEHYLPARFMIANDPKSDRTRR